MLKAVFLLLALMFSVLAASPRNADDSLETSSARSAAKVDINRASISELKTLPGIRDAYASAIYRNRPYKNKAQLLSHDVIPESAYKKIRDRIVARQ